MEYTDRVVALSRSHARYLAETEGVGWGRMAVIENGIDVEHYARADAGDVERLRLELGLGPRDRVVLMVAALRPEKAHEVFLEAARLLVDSRQDVKFLVVGDGPRRAELEALRRRLELEAYVQFLGVRDDVARLLHAAHVLVLPSHPAVETLPLSVLEAMAAGVPVVATRVGWLACACRVASLAASTSRPARYCASNCAGLVMSARVSAHTSLFPSSMVTRPAVPEGVWDTAATTSCACAAKSAIIAPLTAWLNTGSRAALFS